MKKHQKFLQFNGKNIIFLNKDGQYWVALRPICEALEIDVDWTIRITKKDSFLGPELSKQAITVEKNGKAQLRNMTCLPEDYIYTWIYSLQSDSKELNEYKKTINKLILYFFRGTITNRKELLVERIELVEKIKKLKGDLIEEGGKYSELREFENQLKKLNRKLRKDDKEVIQQQLELFSKS